MIEKPNFWYATLLWGTVGIQLLPIYYSIKIYRTYPRVKDWSIAWIFFIISMFSVMVRRVFVAFNFDLFCNVTGLWIFDQIVTTYTNSVLFLIFTLLKERFFIKWFSYDKLKTGKKS